MANDLIRTPEYNVLWDDSGELEFEPWVSRAEAEAARAATLADPVKAEREYGIDPEDLADTVILVRRWRIEYIDDNWDYLYDAKGEEAADAERAQADEARLALEN